MKIYNIYVQDEEVKIVAQPDSITNGSVNTVACKFEFSEDWKDYDKTAVFYNKRQRPMGVYIKDEKELVYVPADIIDSDKKIMYIGVFGTKEDKVKVAVPVEIEEIEDGTPTNIITDKIALSLYAQILELTRKAVDEATAAKEVATEAGIIKENYVEKSRKVAGESLEKDITSLKIINAILSDSEAKLELIAAIKKEVENNSAILEQTANMLNPDEVIKGMYVNVNSGNMVENVAFNTYRDIPVLPETKYVLQRLNLAYFQIAYVFYDETYTYISGDSYKTNPADHYVIETPANAAYLTLSYSPGSDGRYPWDEMMLSQGDKKTIYVPYKIVKRELITPTINNTICGNSETFGTFMKFGVIGDSYSVGCCYNEETGTLDARHIEYSWPQFLARKYGTTAVNLGFSGADTKNWFTHSTYGYADFIKEENLCQAYIIGLGLNDNITETFPLGSTDDIDLDNPDNNAVSFYGQYAKIIQSIKAINPKAKIFALTIAHPRATAKTTLNTAIKDIVAFEGLSTNCFLVDLADKYKEGFRQLYITDYYIGGHFTPAGYANVAELTGKILSDVINKNATEFNNIVNIKY